MAGASKPAVKPVASGYEEWSAPASDPARLLAALDQSIVGTALPQIVSEFNSLDKLSWVVTAYLLTSTASTPLWGKISDLYGRRPLFIAAIVTFLAGSVLAALSQNIEMLIGFRAVQGLGAGGLMSLAFATIGDVIPPRERGKYMGYFGAVFGLSSVAGPLLGGLLTDGPGWRCNRGYNAVRNACVAVEIPANGHLADDVYGSGWECDRGYQRTGKTCALIKIPENAYLDTQGTDWKCERSYRKAHGTCTAFTTPPNAHIDFSGNDWVCDQPYRKQNDSCTLL